MNYHTSEDSVTGKMFRAAAMNAAMASDFAINTINTIVASGDANRVTSDLANKALGILKTFIAGNEVEMDDFVVTVWIAGLFQGLLDKTPGKVPFTVRSDVAHLMYRVVQAAESVQ
jgi:hypothetical protein